MSEIQSILCVLETEENWMFHGTQADVKGIGRYTAFNQHIETVTAYSLNNLSYSQTKNKLPIENIYASGIKA